MALRPIILPSRLSCCSKNWDEVSIMSFILAIDQSTAGTKAILSDEQGFITAKDSINHKQYYPAPGWVEHDAEEIWQNVVKLISRLPEQAGVTLDEINGIAISNQRGNNCCLGSSYGKTSCARCGLAMPARCRYFARI